MGYCVVQNSRFVLIVIKAVLKVVKYVQLARFYANEHELLHSSVKC